MIYFIFFFQAEDGIRDYKVTGVQTCALPIYQRSVVAASCIRLRTRSLPRLQAVENPNVSMSLGSGRSLSIVFGTCARPRPGRALATRVAAKAGAAPPVVVRESTPRRLRVSAPRP